MASIVKQPETSCEECLRSMQLQIERLTAELELKDKMLLQQARLASAGEIVGDIAHQWKIPLNALGLIVQKLQLVSHEHQIPPSHIDECADRSMRIIRNMTQTINDFSNFHKPHEERLFSVNQAIRDAYRIVDSIFESQGIQYAFVELDDLHTRGIQNEFTQVMLNLLSNARDALIESDVEKPEILVTLQQYNGYGRVTVSDNGGGINSLVLERIFDPYFTTKDDNGTGIGLYLSKMIIETKMGGTLTVSNGNAGAVFTIELPVRPEQ